VGSHVFAPPGFYQAAEALKFAGYLAVRYVKGPRMIGLAGLSFTEIFQFPIKALSALARLLLLNVLFSTPRRLNTRLLEIILDLELVLQLFKVFRRVFAFIFAVFRLEVLFTNPFQKPLVFLDEVPDLSGKLFKFIRVSRHSHLTHEFFSGLSHRVLRTP